MKKSDLRFVMKSINHVDLEKLTPTNIENVYLTNDTDVFNQYAFFNGFDYISINPFLYELYDLKVLDDETRGQIKGLMPEMSDDKMKAAVDEHKNRVKKMAEKNKWTDVFLFIEKKIGLQVLIREFDNIPDDQKYDCFINIYTRSDFGFEILKDHYEKIFSFAEFSKKRSQRLKKLRKKVGKDEFTIYHGVSYDFPVYDYYSWTLRENTASFFAHRYSRYGQVLEKKITAIDAVDFLTDRNEEEILYKPNPTFLKIMFRASEEQEN